MEHNKLSLVKVTIPEEILDLFRNRNDKDFDKWEDHLDAGEGDIQDYYSGSKCSVMILENELLYNNKIWIAHLVDGINWCGMGKYGGNDVRQFYFPKSFCKEIQKLEVEAYSEYAEELYINLGRHNELEYGEKSCRFCNCSINKDSSDGLCKSHSKKMKLILEGGTNA